MKLASQTTLPGVRDWTQPQTARGPELAGVIAEARQKQKREPSRRQDHSSGFLRSFQSLKITENR